MIDVFKALFGLGLFYWIGKVTRMFWIMMIVLIILLIKDYVRGKL